MLALHDAADGRLARVRVPGGRLSAEAMLTVAAAAEELGNGLLDVTARANLQLRGLRDGADVAADLAARLHDGGLLPSPGHDPPRTVLASPLAGRAPGARDDVDDVVALLDGGPRARRGLGLGRADRLRRDRRLRTRPARRARGGLRTGLTRSAREPVEHWAGCQRRCGELPATPVSVAVAAIDVVEVRYHGDTWHLPSLTSTAARLELEAPR